MLTKDLALQLAPRGVRVNAVAPGWITAKPIAFVSHALGQTTMPVEAIAHAVTFLSDHRRSFATTGHELIVDAGASINRRR